MPHYLALGCANALVLLCMVYEGAAIFTAYAGLLRIGEALALLWSNCFRAVNSWIFTLGRTKTGSNQKVVISGVTAVTWLESFF